MKSTEKKLISSILSAWKEILDRNPQRVTVSEILTKFRTESERINRDLYETYKHLDAVSRPSWGSDLYQSFLLEDQFKGRLWIPYSLFLDLATGTILPMLTREYLIEGKQPESISEFFDIYDQVTTTHFGQFTKMEIRILKAIMALYGANGVFDVPPTPDVADKVRSNYQYVNSLRQQLRRWGYSYQALTNYGKFGFQTFISWNTPKKLEEEFSNYRLLTLQTRENRVVAWSMPKDFYKEFQKKFVDSGLPEESLNPISAQSWHWNLSQLQNKEETSWRTAPRRMGYLQQLLVDQTELTDYKVQEPQLIQDLTPVKSKKDQVSLNQSDVIILDQLVDEIPEINWIASDAEQSDTQVMETLERFKESKVIDINLNFRFIGLGAGFAVALTSPKPLNKSKDPKIKQIISLLQAYPFSWTLAGERALMAYILVPRKWGHEFLLDWAPLIPQLSTIPDDKLYAFDFGCRHNRIVNPIINLNWSKISSFKNGKLEWQK